MKCGFIYPLTWAGAGLRISFVPVFTLFWRHCGGAAVYAILCTLEDKQSVVQSIYRDTHVAGRLLFTSLVPRYVYDLSFSVPELCLYVHVCNVPTLHALTMAIYTM